MFIFSNGLVWLCTSLKLCNSLLLLVDDLILSSHCFHWYLIEMLVWVSWFCLSKSGRMKRLHDVWLIKLLCVLFFLQSLRSFLTKLVVKYSAFSPPNRPLNASRRVVSWSGLAPVLKRCTCWCRAAGRESLSRGWWSKTSTAACSLWSRTRPFTWTSWAEGGPEERAGSGEDLI